MSTVSEVEQGIFEASRKGDIELLENLILKNPNVSVDSFVAADGSTALLIACRHGASVDIIKLLIRAGKDTCMLKYILIFKL